MPIRGKRSIYPKAGSPPSGIFSTRGSQKVDSTDHFKEKGVQSYAHSTRDRSKPKGGNGSLRHQKPRTLKQQMGS
jgi:hypothetical protein